MKGIGLSMSIYVLRISFRVGIGKCDFYYFFLSICRFLYDFLCFFRFILLYVINVSEIKKYGVGIRCKRVIK